MENKKEMKTYRYYIMTLALSLFVAGCSEDEITKRPSANVGDEVKFGLSLPGLSTRTIYGEEIENKFPIYWVDGDLVKVASPQCLAGRNSAEYSISAGEQQNYATSMTKTGAHGVQWGNSEKADFYSIYPSTDGTELDVSDASNVTATLHVDATQYASTTDYVDSCYAQPANMGNVVMYAVTKNVLNTEEAVELRYKPFSTVIEFEITAPDESDASHQSEITIQSLTLVAPSNTSIAGDFTFTFPADDKSNPSATANAGGSNAITLHFLDNNQYTTVLSTTKQKLKAKMCLMPISDFPASVWTVALNTSAGTFVKNITLGNLTAGLVHKIKLPKLNYSSEEWKYSLTNWITSLPDYKNIYLSEISLPGAWYAGSDEAYQETSDIARLWNHGVRAFAVETRVISSTTLRPSQISSHGKPEGVVVSGSGGNSAYNYPYGTNSLHADSKSNASVYKNGTSISTIITNIANQVKADEYGVLVLSYADGGDGGRRYIDYGAWLQLLNDAYNSLNDAVKAKIYQDQNAITANTTVNDVLGKLILKINVDANIAMNGTVDGKTYEYVNNLPALLSYNPFLYQMTEDEKYSVPFFSNLSWKTWGDDTDTHRTYFPRETAETMDNPFVWCFSSANRTQLTGKDGTVPTYQNRKDALSSMMTFSRQIYEASTHNVWFYFNCGGTEATSSESKNPSPTDFAKEMNPWLLKLINAKTDPSPLGIVMFNRCTDPDSATDTYHGPEIIKAIVEMNSKFYLKHAGANTGSSTGGTATQESAVKSAAPGYSAGMVDKKTNAISWESSE